MMSPAQQLLEKLLLKQQQQSSAEASSSLSSQLILFQYSCHVSFRETAAISQGFSGNATKAAGAAVRTTSTRIQQQQFKQTAQIQAQADLYKRAQLRRPAEDAQRMTWGGPLWIEYLTKELIRLVQVQQQQSQGGSVVWVSTTTRPIPKWINDNDDDNSSDKGVVVVNATFLYQDLWEKKEDITTEQQQQQQHPLEVLLERIRTKIEDSSSSCTAIPVVMESITPLIQIYGFSSVLHLIQQILSLPNILLLLPILSETMMTSQKQQQQCLQQLEDLAHTTLWLSNHTGQVDLHVLRRGIREQDSTVREIWDFSIVPPAENNTSDNSFALVVGGDRNVKDDDEEEQKDGEPPDQINLLQAMNPALNPETSTNKSTQQNHKQRPNPPPQQPNKKKITLKLEDDSNKPMPPTNKAVTQPATSSAQPRIFLQDDDPEFEDYDEEDPDDDLDL